MARRRAGVRVEQRLRAQARETLERGMADLLDRDDTLAPLVTGEEARREPFHRWFSYRQQFSPGLVRRFLAEARPAGGPILDPFSGAGTTVIACAQAGVRSVGVEPIGVLAFLACARFLREAPAGLPPERPSLEEHWRAAERPADRAALLFAAARKGPLAENLRDVVLAMAADLRRPLAPLGLLLRGDARALPLADASMGGMLASPPYLSRYDYVDLAAPLERLFRGAPAPRASQIPAAVGRRAPAAGGADLPPAAEEAARHLEPGRARLVRRYFSDLARFLREARRVLRPSAPAWIVIGGADVDREYIPADLICAEQARETGFELEGISEARRLRTAGRFLGLLRDVAPRESIVRLRRGGGEGPRGS